MTQVFISYSRKDLEFVDRLANDLKATGFEVWYDLSGLEPGTRWRQEIQKAIQDSQYFLVVLSPNSIISDWVEREFLFASDQDIKIIPLLYQSCTLPMWSLNLHFIDMQGKNYALHYQDLMKVMGIKKGSEENPIAIRYIEIGDEYRKRGQASQAIESYQQALTVDPGSLKSRTSIGAVHLMEQEYSRAIEAYELALQISSEDLVARAGWCDANMALGNQARADGRMDEATRYYLEILRIDPLEPDAQKSLVNIYTSRAESLLSAGQEDEALSAFSEAIKYNPDDSSLTSRLEKMRTEKKNRVLNDLMARSEAEISAGNWGQALVVLNEALGYEPKERSILEKIEDIKKHQLQGQLEALLSKVEQAEKAQRWDAAMTGLKEYLNLKPDDKGIQKRMADLMQSKHAAWLAAVTLRVDQALNERNWDAALGAINEALQLEPDNKELLSRADRVEKDQHSAKLNATIIRADQAAGAGRWEDALDILNTALGSDPGNATLKAKLTETLLARRKKHLQSVMVQVDAAERAGKWESALASLNQVLSEEPDNPEFLEKFNSILTLERESRLNLLRTRATSLMKEHKFEETMAAWNEILLLAPENRQAVLAEIEAINKAQKLEASYSDGVKAFADKEYQKATDLLNSVRLEQPGYKDTVKLLAKARKQLRSPQNKPNSASRRIWILVGVLVVLALGIGGLKLLLERDNPTATPTVVAEITGSSTATPQVPTPTPDPRILNPANQHQYLYVKNNKSWQDARDDCAARGGYLVTIQDAAENQLIYEAVFGSTWLGSTWLGATDENNEGLWAWVSGEPWMYTNWAFYQPDNDISNDSSGENYLTFLWPEARVGEFEVSSQWIDVPNGSRSYVCEWEPSLQGETITVTSAEDSGTGTLRQALLEARAGDIITFDPATFTPDDPVAINLYSQLPVIDQGYLTLDASNAGVVLNGSHVGGEWTPGIDIWSDHNIIQGLGIVSFSGPGIYLQANANFNTIGGDRGIGSSQIGEGNFVGANSDGIGILGSDNVITGNLVGILGADSEDLEVGNRAAGIFIADKASRNTIGPDNIIAYNGTVAGCGIEYTSLEAKNNNLTANIIYGNEPDSPGICYNINPGGQFVYSTPPTIFYFDLESGTAAGQTSGPALVEIFSTDTQDAKIFEGAVKADEYGNFVFRKSGALTGPFLTATTRYPGKNTSEFSLPTPERTDLMIALDKVWVSAPYFETAFNSSSSIYSRGDVKFEDGKLIITSFNPDGATVTLADPLSSNLAVEFELTFLDSLQESVCVMEIMNDQPVGQDFKTLSAEFWQDGEAILSRYHPDLNGNERVAANNFDVTQTNVFKLINLGDQFAAFINGQVAYVSQDSGGVADYTHVALSAYQSITCEFDNYKLWDLSGVILNP